MSLSDILLTERTGFRFQQVTVTHCWAPGCHWLRWISGCWSPAAVQSVCPLKTQKTQRGSVWFYCFTWKLKIKTHLQRWRRWGAVRPEEREECLLWTGSCRRRRSWRRRRCWAPHLLLLLLLLLFLSPPPGQKTEWLAPAGAPAPPCPSAGCQLRGRRRGGGGGGQERRRRRGEEEKCWIRPENSFLSEIIMKQETEGEKGGKDRVVVGGGGRGRGVVVGGVIGSGWGGVVPLSLRSKALSSVSMRGNSSLDGQLQIKHMILWNTEYYVLYYRELHCFTQN